MLIWLNLLIPILAIIVLIVFFRTKMSWWEYLLVFAVPLITIAVCKYTSIMYQTNTSEQWNSYALRAEYEEPWDEWVHQTCYRTVSCGKNCTSSVPYDCSHRVYHPAVWRILDNLGDKYGVSGDYYKYLVGLWGNQNFQDMNRNYYRQDGNKYYATFPDTLPKNFDKVIPLSTRHTYVNKVRSSKSVFNFQDVSKDEVKQYGLYSYPKHNMLQGTSDMINYNPIFGWNNLDDSRRLQRYNGILGNIKRVHMMILVFNNQPYTAAVMQEAYWKGGNKNEFILCIGTSGKKITWTKVISWTDREDLKARFVRIIKAMDTLNMPVVIDSMANNVKLKYIKKDFKDFDYITVEPSDKAILIAFILTLVFTIGLSIFSVMNRFDVDGESSPIKRRRY